jgi:hypothetical protein
MNKKNKVHENLNILNEIKILRSFFSISYIYKIGYKDDLDKKRFFIKPFDDRIKLDDFFYQKADAYENMIKELLKSDWDLLKQKEILNDELIIINEIIDLKSAQDIVEYFEPIFVDLTFDEKNTVLFKLEDNFDDIEIKYISAQFSIRKKYLRRVSKIIKMALVELDVEIKNPIKVTGIDLRKLDKILSEFWYLSEVEVFKEQFNEKQLSVLRNQFFSLFGASANKYSKCKSDILERKEDNRFSDLAKLIQVATNNLHTIDSRGVSALRKKLDKTKK